LDTNGNGVGDACATSSVDDQFTSQIKLYPNPSNGSFNLVISSDVSDGKIKIFDNLGHVVRSIEFRNDSGMLEVRNMSPGYYNVVIIDASDGRTGVKRVLIME
jgi:hypothetical protein